MDPSRHFSNQKQNEEALKQEMEMRKNILSQILEQDARARLATISMVKPEKAQQIENGLINMARAGRLTSKLSEEMLIQMIEQFNKEMEPLNKTKINRRRYQIDDDDEEE